MRVSRRWIVGLLAVIVLPALPGCQTALTGDWYMVQAIPNRDTFAIDNATFRGDGTYSATTTIEGLTQTEKGTYDFVGYKLKLRPQAGGQRTYSTVLKLNRLEIMDGPRKVVLQKGRRGG